MDWICCYFSKVTWSSASDFFNSTFFTSITGSLAGAFAGAYGAQRIAERAEKKKELIKEIRNTNASIMVAFGICNSLLALKKQHVRPLKETFDRQKTALLDHDEKRRSGQIPKDMEFKFVADLETLSLPPLPLNILLEQLFEKLSLTGRPLNLGTTLSQAVHSLNASLEKRNQLIEFYKAGEGKMSHFPALYFGLRQSEHVNQEYPSVLDAISSHTDDVIFFSQLLCKDLAEHGEHISERFKKEFGKKIPKISKVDFTKAETAGLMPRTENYADWINAFGKVPDSLTFLQKILKRWRKTV